MSAAPRRARPRPRRVRVAAAPRARARAAPAPPLTPRRAASGRFLPRRYGIVGQSFFGANDKIHFRNLPIAMLTLFRCATCEDWTDVMYINIFGCDARPYGRPGNFVEWAEETPGREVHAGGAVTYGPEKLLCTAPASFPVLAPVYVALSPPADSQNSQNLRAPPPGTSSRSRSSRRW